MGVFSNDGADYRERRAIFYEENPDAKAGQFEQQMAQRAWGPEQRGDGRGDQTAPFNVQRPDVSTRITDYYPLNTPLIGAADQRPQEVRPIHNVQKFDSRGNRIGTSEYIYHPNAKNGALLDGYVDRDARGHISEFAVRKPKTDPSERDVFMVFRSTPEHPISEQSMKHVVDLLRTDVPAAERKANQIKLNQERPLLDNIVMNNGNKIVAIDLDPQTGQRFTLRDQRIDPNTGRQIADRTNLVLCWDGPNKTTYRYPVAQMPQGDQQDIYNARWHGNMAQPLRFLYEGGQAAPRRINGGSDGMDGDQRQPVIQNNRQPRPRR